jgi:Family of unknown function (DUF6519)
MKGDFARTTFHPQLHFSQVLHQQGRALLEADWNEQGAIQLHLLRSLIVDLVGACWAAGDGFEISQQGPNNRPLALKDWRLSPGHFYVDGILCENEPRENQAESTLALQSHRPTPDDGSDGSSGFENPPDRFMLYLDVWERHLSALEAPMILDRALGGIDTATRAQVIWQVRMLGVEAAMDMGERAVEALRLRDDVPPFAQALLRPDFDIREAIQELFDRFAGDDEADRQEACRDFRILLGLRNDFAYPRLKAGLGPIDAEADACIIAPDARFRGCENQLYRVEIHAAGPAWSGGNTGETSGATFKWSRENGSVIFPVVSAPASADEVAGGTQYVIGLGHLGRDLRLGLAIGDWVELSDDTIALAQRALPLLQVTAIDTANKTVTVVVPDALNHVPSLNMTRHPLLRRWDQRDDVDDDGSLPVREGGDGVELEDGVTITFEPGGLYATGDYWVIPARVADNGSLDWPMDGDEPLAVKAKGLHHYAVLGGVDGNGGYDECCCRVPPLCERRAQRLDEVRPRPTPTGGARPLFQPRDGARDAAAGAVVKPAKSRRGTPAERSKEPPTP